MDTIEYWWKLEKKRGNRGAGLLTQPTDSTIAKTFIEQGVDIHLASKEDWLKTLVVREHEISIYLQAIGDGTTPNLARVAFCNSNRATFKSGSA